MECLVTKVRLYKKTKKNLDPPEVIQVRRLNAAFLEKQAKKYEYILTLLRTLVQTITKEIEKFKSVGKYNKALCLYMYGYRLDGYTLIDCLRLAIYYSVIPDPFYFTFGRYAGRIVQDIIEEDFSYCEWFKDNVIGIDYYSLKAVDYFHKLSKRHIYYDKNIYIAKTDILEQFIPDDWQDELWDNKLLRFDDYFIVTRGIVEYNGYDLESYASCDLEEFLEEMNSTELSEYKLSEYGCLEENDEDFDENFDESLVLVESEGLD